MSKAIRIFCNTKRLTKNLPLTNIITLHSNEYNPGLHTETEQRKILSKLFSVINIDIDIAIEIYFDYHPQRYEDNDKIKSDVYYD